MQISAGELSELLKGELLGDPKRSVSRPAKIEEATETDISFIGNEKYGHFATATRAGILIVSKQFNISADVHPAIIKVDQPYEAFARVLEYFALDFAYKGVDNKAQVSADSILGEDVYVGAFAYVGSKVRIGPKARIFPGVYVGDNSSVGDATVIYPGVKIYPGTVIGSNCIIHAGAVIGGDGFGFVPERDGTLKKVPQLGNVVIEDNVEIGANTTIDRATMGSTIIRKGAKLDNLVQVAHNVEIGANTVIAAQTGISGSTKLGDYCMVGGQVGFAGHISIAPQTKIGAQSGISKNIKTPGKAWNGSPAFEYKDSMKSLVLFRKLPELEARISELESLLEQQINSGKENND